MESAPGGAASDVVSAASPGVVSDYLSGAVTDAVPVWDGPGSEWKTVLTSAFRPVRAVRLVDEKLTSRVDAGGGWAPGGASRGCGFGEGV